MINTSSGNTHYKITKKYLNITGNIKGKYNEINSWIEVFDETIPKQKLKK